MGPFAIILFLYFINANLNDFNNSLDSLILNVHYYVIWSIPKSGYSNRSFTF